MDATKAVTGTAYVSSVAVVPLARTDAADPGEATGAGYPATFREASSASDTLVATREAVASSCDGNFPLPVLPRGVPAAVPHAPADNNREMAEFRLRTCGSKNWGYINGHLGWNSVSLLWWR